MSDIHQTAVIGNRVKIGKNTKIGAFVLINDDVQIGDNVTIKPYCEIRSGCKIGNGASFGSRCTLAGNTIVEDDINMKYGCVATDTPKLNKAERLPCHLKKGSRYGANVTIMPGIVIGENSEIGACSQVRNDVPNNEVWFGNPAKFYRKF